MKTVILSITFVADKRKRGELDVDNHPLTRPAMIESQEGDWRFSTIGAALEYPGAYY